MTNNTAAGRRPAVFERVYEAPLQDVWDLWTTKDGFESWWGPEGFRVEVHSFDFRTGGALAYDMIADAPEQVTAMEQSGMGTRHATHGAFVEIEPLKRLKLLHIIDFIPGLDPYENHILVELFEEGDKVRMKVTIEAHTTDEWTRAAAAGFESQLTKVPSALAARRA